MSAQAFLSTLLNGAGPFVALSAIPMVVGLLLREGPFASQLRRLAILMAVILPAIFMLLVGWTYLSAKTPGNTFFDFAVNYRAAQVLYRQNGNPYSVQAAYSFPFPSFYLYWLGSGFGTLQESVAWIVWWIINTIVWAMCALALLRTLPRASSNHARDLRHYAAVAIPAVTVLWQGQTALFALAGLTLLHNALHSALPREKVTVPTILGGIGLAFAILIKPQVALVGLGLVLYLLLHWRDVTLRAKGISIILASGVTVLILLALTLILPGGVSLDTYQRFVSEALPQVARPADNITVIGSPAFAAGYLALQANLPESAVNLVSTFVTILVGLAAIYWTVKRSDRALTEIASGWAVWAMVIPRVTWTWYAAWCLPFFLLAVDDAITVKRQRWYFVLLVIDLALLNLQLPSIPLELVTILVLIYLLWTSFSRTRSTELVD